MLTKVKPGSDVSTLTKLARSLVKNHRLIVSESEIRHIVDSIFKCLVVGLGSIPQRVSLVKQLWQFLGWKIMTVNSQEFLGIPNWKKIRLRNLSIPRNSKQFLRITENNWEFFCEILEFLGKSRTNNGCVYIFLAFEVKTNNIKWGHNHQSE